MLLWNVVRFVRQVLFISALVGVAFLSLLENMVSGLCAVNTQDAQLIYSQEYLLYLANKLIRFSSLSNLPDILKRTNRKRGQLKGISTRCGRCGSTWLPWLIMVCGNVAAFVEDMLDKVSTYCKRNYIQKSVNYLIYRNEITRK